ncbi:MAG TPA: SDR family oxidoreductase [Nitrospiria bacterium]|nr:SDR family oxidoreductase [Nitrospiria bacterium]
MLSVLIVGCGYVGLSLGKAFVSRGETVYGTTRSPNRMETIAREGMRPILLDVLKPPFGLPAVDLAYFLVAGTGDETLPRGMSNLIGALSDRPPKKFVYTSSTGVYGDYGGAWVDESSPRRGTHPAGERLIRTEDLLLSAFAKDCFPGVIARLSGIYGPDRIPGLDRIRKKEPIPGSPDAFLNLIHLEDLIGSLIACGSRGRAGEVYLISDDHPVRRNEYYQFLAERLNAGAVSFQGEARERSGSRRCRNQKMKEELSVELKYPSYREGIEALVPRNDG